MPKKVYCIVEDHRMLVNKKEVEDVTVFTPPTIEHPTTSLQNVSGLAGDIDMPNQARVNALECAVAHNNGVNANLLIAPGVLNLEFRAARQYYDVPKNTMEHGVNKYRVTCIHQRTEPGTIETGNPEGKTEYYKVTSYEEIKDGKTINKIDIPAGIIEKNGKRISDKIQKLLK